SIFPHCRGETERARSFAGATAHIAWSEICHRCVAFTDGRVMDIDALQRGGRARTRTARRVHWRLASACARVFPERGSTIAAGPGFQLKRHCRRAAGLHREPKHRKTVLA